MLKLPFWTLPDPRFPPDPPPAPSRERLAAFRRRLAQPGNARATKTLEWVKALRNLGTHWVKWENLCIKTYKNMRITENSVVILCGFDIFLEDLSCKHIVNAFAFADFAITPFNPKTKVSFFLTLPRRYCKAVRLWWWIPIKNADLLGIGELNAYNLQSFKSKMCYIYIYIYT